MEFEILEFIKNMKYTTVEEIKNYIGDRADGTLRQGPRKNILYMINGSQEFADAIYNVINDPKIICRENAELCESIDGYKYCEYTTHVRDKSLTLQYIPLILAKNPKS
jgi:hypothetical protein